MILAFASGMALLFLMTMASPYILLLFVSGLGEARSIALTYLFKAKPNP
jgi:hypothetical protein